MGNGGYRPEIGERLAALETRANEMASKGAVDLVIAKLEIIQRDVTEIKGLARQESENSFELSKKYTDAKLKESTDHADRIVKELDEDVGHRLQQQEKSFEWAKILIPVAIPVLLGLFALLSGKSGSDAAEAAVTYQSF